MKLYLANLTGKPLPRSLAAALRAGARAVLEEAGLSRGEVGIILAGDALLHRLNREFRHVDRPTDVLAFPYLHPEPGEPRERFPAGEPPAVGEVYISLARAREQARAAGHPLEREVLLLALHGLLHLAGWDHATPGAERAMRDRESALLKRIGSAGRGGGHA